MTDIYFKALDRAIIDNLRGFVINVIEPVKGQAATEETPAVGDPSYWYTCVRVPFDILAFDGLEVCTEEEGLAVCGGFA